MKLLTDFFNHLLTVSFTSSFENLFLKKRILQAPNTCFAERGYIRAVIKMGQLFPTKLTYFFLLFLPPYKTYHCPGESQQVTIEKCKVHNFCVR